MQDYSDMGRGTMITGAVLGAIGALLLAPQTGRETRRWLAEYTNLGSEKLREAGEEAHRYLGRAQGRFNGSRFSSREETGAHTTFALTGALVGVAAALLFAPQSGAETRQWLAEQARRGQERVKEGAEQIKQYAQEGSQRIRQAANEGVDRTHEAFRKTV